MTAALAIIVILLAAGLLYALSTRREKSRTQPEVDLGPVIQEATSKAIGEAIPGFLRANEEARKVDVQAAEAALQKREAEFRRLTEPIGKNLERIEKEVVTLTRDRRSADGAVKTLLAEMKAGLGDLGTQTGTLVKALRQPQTRGKWGEVQLKRCVEIAGMTEHVDFELQQTMNDGEALLRPDAVVMLPGKRRVVVDSKVPLDAYLEVLEAADDVTRKGELIRHARQVREHITKLASKRYQDQFPSGESPDFVVCFMPSEAALHAAFEAEPSLYDYALEQKILIATPTTLVGLLRTVELGWRQEQIAEQAQEIAAAARELHSRTGSFLEHFAKAGRQLSSATKSFDDAVGSLESRIMPQLRRIEEMGAASGKELEEPRRVDRAVRPIVAEELREIETGGDPEGPALELPSRLDADAA
ncbi:MAG TPA: DNA recombination protein RmuC [Solirubrobacterales bacterium]|nr:DNA recombination protein RmuC [Solirubrobacterales bacterium]